MTHAQQCIPGFWSGLWLVTKTLAHLSVESFGARSVTVLRVLLQNF